MILVEFMMKGANTRDGPAWQPLCGICRANVGPRAASGGLDRYAMD